MMAGEVDELKMFVGNLSWQVKPVDLEAAVAHIDAHARANVIVDRSTGRSRGFGFIVFSQHAAALRALHEMDGRELGGRPIRVNSSTPRTGGGGGGGGGGPALHGGGPHMHGGGAHAHAGPHNGGHHVSHQQQQQQQHSRHGQHNPHAGHHPSHGGGYAPPGANGGYGGGGYGGSLYGGESASGPAGLNGGIGGPYGGGGGNGGNYGGPSPPPQLQQQLGGYGREQSGGYGGIQDGYSPSGYGGGLSAAAMRSAPLASGLGRGLAPAGPLPIGYGSGGNGGGGGGGPYGGAQQSGSALSSVLSSSSGPWSSSGGAGGSGSYGMPSSGYGLAGGGGLSSSLLDPPAGLPAPVASAAPAFNPWNSPSLISVAAPQRPASAPLPQQQSQPGFSFDSFGVGGGGGSSFRPGSSSLLGPTPAVPIAAAGWLAPRAHDPAPGPYSLNGHSGSYGSVTASAAGAPYGSSSGGHAGGEYGGGFGSAPQQAPRGYGPAPGGRLGVAAGYIGGSAASPYGGGGLAAPPAAAPGPYGSYGQYNNQAGSGARGY